jgi:DnaJ family protein B protein 4
MTEDFYSILEVSKDASEQDIKKAYRKLNLQYHPDRNNSADAESKIRKINEAYETLGDQNKRQMYDNGFNQGFPGGGPDINNIFNMFFNGGGFPGFGQGGIHVFHNGMPHFVKPPPIQHISVISLEQAFHGCSLDIKIKRIVSRGNSTSEEFENITVPIHPGFDNESFILQEKGNIIENCKGDIHLVIKIENKTIFKRQNMDLIYNKTITLKESLCGFSFEITNLDEKIIKFSNLEDYTIINPNQKIIMPNMGMKKEGFGSGNLIIEFAIEFPKTLSFSQRESLNQIL